MIHKAKHLYKTIEKEIKKHMIPASIVLALIILLGAWAISQKGFSVQNIKVGGLLGPSDKAIALKAIDYINNNKLSQDTATLSDKSISRESGLIKFKIKIGTNEFDSYTTRDGKFFFPQVFTLP